ncbi:MAG: DUF4255 domain-containing protein [Kofleriaceae bacterium]
MSNTLAIGAVTATLQQILGDIAVPIGGDPDPDPDLADAHVTCRPLDKARENEMKSQLNLFLYQVQANPTFRNASYSGVHDGESANQPLALNLYYVATAYGAGGDDLLAHRVLGRAMSILHDRSTLLRDALRSAMPKSDLARQVERVRVRPHALSVDELSKLWQGFHRPYRLSVGYEVSVVLIESTRPSTAGLPVLIRGGQVRANLELPYPILESFLCDQNRPAMRLGEPLTLSGKNIGGTPFNARFSHRLLPTPHTLQPTGAHDATHAELSIPNDPANWPAGIYSITVETTTDQVRTTNTVAIPLAPQILTITKITSTPSLLVLAIGCAPEVRSDQRVSLIVGDRQIEPEPFTDHDAMLTFTIQDPPTGLTYLRLRVDGVDSLLVTNFTQAPPVYDPSQSVALP